MSNSQNKKNEQQNNLCTILTEQWEKGELEVDQYYYVKYADGSVEIQLYVGGFLMRTDNRVVEVLAPVPNYEEWKQLHKFLEEFNALDVAKENQQLKELLKECREVLLSYSNISGDYELYDKITKAIGEK